MLWSSMRQAVDIKVSKVMECVTVVVDFTTKMEGTTRVTGRATKWMGMVSYTTRVVK